MLDLPEAIAELGSDGSPVAVISLCSGAYSSMEAALRTQFDAIIAINPRVDAFEFSKGRQTYSADRLVARPPIAPLGKLGRNHRILAGGLWRIYRQVTPWNSPVAGLAAVVRRSRTDLFVLSDVGDARPFHEVVLPSLALPLLRRTGRYRMVVDPGLDHSMLTQVSQRVVREVATQYLQDRYTSVAELSHER